MSGQTTGIKSQKTELNRTIEELELALKAKEEVQGVLVRPTGLKSWILHAWTLIGAFTICSELYTLSDHACRSWRDLKQRWRVPMSLGPKEIPSHRGYRCVLLNDHVLHKD